MDFHAAMETFAEAWVAANTQTAVNTEGQATKQTPMEDLPTQLPRDQLVVTKTSPIKLPPPVSPDNSPSSSSTRSLPIHCIIEQTSGTPSFDNSSGDKSAHNSVELDSYAILPGTTLLSECVRAAIIKLGYNSTEAIGAKGAIQVKNWKPLCFDAISDNKNVTIDDILGELTQVVTLRIRICSATKLNSADEVKEKLLQLLLNQSQSLLTNAGCHGDKASMSTNEQTMATISPEMRKAFDRWYEEQLKAYSDSNGTNSSSVNMAMAAKNLLAMQQERFDMAMAAAQRGAIVDADDKTTKKCLSPPSQVSPPVARPMAASTPTEVSPSMHPALQSIHSHYLPGKTRMRTSFDPEHEIPRLQKWFSENQHPSRELMLHYLSELNSLDSRKGRRPLDLTNIIYWFKNARAAHRRAAKSSEDDSFEMEEEKEMPPVSSASEGLPFLPNRNAVYMVPYPHFPNLGINNHLGLLNVQSRFNGHHDNKEPCDLSLGRRSMDSFMPKSPSPTSVSRVRHIESIDLMKTLPKADMNKSSNDTDAINVKVETEEPENSPSRSDEGYAEMTESPPEGRQSPEPIELKVPESYIKSEASLDHNQPKDLSQEKPKDIYEHSEVTTSYNRAVGNDNIDEPTDLTKDKCNDLSLSKSAEEPSDLSQNKPKILTNGKRPYESDDDLESDYDDDDRSIDGSVSSHDESKMTNLRESYLNAARGLNYNPVSSSPSGQPLHIPQFPHPLAMHYFPLNTHLYTQQANQMKFHNHQHSTHQQTTPKPSPGQGQENNSHRKRRTRVFIDPLSEIPKLEKWFLDDTHPSSYMIDKYCEELNSSEYRQKFPRLEPKNVQLWFKNHRAKVKRMRIGGVGEHIMFD